MVLSAFSQSESTENKVILALGIYFSPQGQGESPAAPCQFKFINITSVWGSLPGAGMTCWLMEEVRSLLWKGFFFSKYLLHIAITIIEQL